jgi:phage FluMu protein Com
MIKIDVKPKKDHRCPICRKLLFKCYGYSDQWFALIMFCRGCKQITEIYTGHKLETTAKGESR